jgi:hypothetical protein
MKQRNPDRIKHFWGVIAIFMLLLLCGCVGNSYWTWQHPDKQSELQLLKDRNECRNLAQTEVAQINYFYDFYDYGMDDFPFYAPSYRNRFYRPYFRGYHNYKFFQQQNDLERFFRICMKAKGWQRVKIEPD